MIGLVLAALLHAAPLPPVSDVVLAQNREPKDGGRRPPPEKKKRRDDKDRREEDAFRCPPLSAWAAPR